MKGKNLIMCGLCICVGFIGGEVRAHYKALRELQNLSRQRVTYMNHYDKGQRLVDRCIFQNCEEAEKVLDEMKKIIKNYGYASLADYYDLCGVNCDYTDNNYVFTSCDVLGKTKIVRCFDGYTHEFPKAIKLKEMKGEHK